MPQERTFDTGVVKLNYLDQGPPTGEPLVMLHGGAWCWQEYLSLIPRLSRRWHIFALDLRGNGRSTWAPGTYRLEDFADDTTAFVEQLNAPAVLVGHSIGGVIALTVAARCPDRVKALVIEDVPLTLDHYRSFIDESRDLFRQWLDLKRSAQSEQDLALALADAHQEYSGVTSFWLLFFASCLWQLDPTFFDALLHDFDGFARAYDPPRILETIACPILFVTGESRLGAVMTDEEVGWLRRNFGHVTCAQIGGVGHLLHLQEQGQAPVLAQVVLRGKYNGAKSDTEAMSLSFCWGSRGAFCLQGRSTVRTAGADRSENAGMSSAKHVKTVFAVNLRFPTPGQSASG